ncbi:major facilitator superfamily domain-containing protein [Annulohypoxylon maeteangense]|uniref:major facilitator superfamily domain-containing protein n=1 Tax=Annulohypoxylon maeteangense TaxID=1927788 RepID=UPI002008C33B|nr:major facilitator superfamily domain-containing protein [Annulohypoxylon maeteangense]KAI0881670.1 major facilitator superfamily domain-containing protein [Annulohypoxylon maeteangense]
MAVESEGLARNNGDAKAPNDNEKYGDILPSSGEDEQQVKETPPRDVTGWKWYMAITAILFSIFLYALDNTVVADIQSIIIKDLGEVDKLSWLSVAFLLTATATNLVWGRLYGQFNAKWFYIFNVFLFEVGSAICGAAPNINALIVGRALCGIGGAGLYVGCMSLIAMTTTMAERPLYISMTGFTWGAGIVLGPVIGGAFSQSAVGWRWAFYINLFIGAVCAPAYLFLIPSIDPRPGVSFKERAQEMDYTGTVLQMGAMVTFVLAINWGGVTYPWKSGHIIGLFVASGVLFILLGIQQAYAITTTAIRRIIPVQFFRSRSVLILFSCTAASGACAFVPIYFVPIFFQFSRGDGPLDAGVRLLPFIAVMVVVVFANGALLSKLGYYMPWYTAGGLFAMAGGALMYTVDSETSESRIYGYTVILGLGVGMFLQASFSVVQAVVDPENIPPAVGFLTLAQFAGITIALAIANAIYLNESETQISKIAPFLTQDQIELAMQGAAGDAFNDLPADTRAAILNVITTAISKTYILVIAGGSLVAILSLAMKRERLFAPVAVGAA